MRSLALAVLLLIAATKTAAAGCTDPVGCWRALCAYPGNVLELTMLGEPTADGLWHVRVDAVHVVDAELFLVPEVGGERDIAPIASNTMLAVPADGESFVAVTQGPGNSAWSPFVRDEGGVTCPSGGPTNHLSIDEMVTVIASGDCNSGRPLPKPLAECNDQGEGDCAAGGTSLTLVLAALTLASLRRVARG